MKTINNIFMYIFAGIGLMALIAVCTGAYHQAIIAAMCFFMTLVIKAENRKEAKK